ncbi:MAG: DNA-3-methyladenine glycosylase 2 family protein [Azospirillaceae bacterium]
MPPSASAATTDIAAAEAALIADAARLARRVPVLAPALDHVERFPIRLRGPGFATLLKIILDQQVSTAAADAMWRRLESALPDVEPEGFLSLDADTLKACGFSRQKANYGQALARAILDGSIDLDRIAGLEDAPAMEALTALKGIGTWSAECYLLFGLGRRDVLPAKDLALQIGWQIAARVEARPGHDELYALGEDWRPHRSAASFMLWRIYIAWQADRRAEAAARKPAGGKRKG